MKKLAAVLLAVACAATADADDGPFGFVAGWTKEQVEKATGGPLKTEGADDGLYIPHSVPRPAERFATYALSIGPSGLCAITALAADIPTSSHGVQVRAAFDETRSMLVEAYGKPTKDQDVLLPGSIWKEPQDWMMGMLKKERRLGALWDGRMKNRITKIVLMANASRSQVGGLTLLYHFDNYPECEAAAKSKERKAF